MTLLVTENVTKSYGATQALKGVDFEVHAGAVNVLIGENGAGKSTLMRIIAGIEQPSGGRILLDGAPLHIESVQDAARRGIGIVHQELSLCPNLSVRENIFLGHALAPNGVIDQRAERERTLGLLEWLRCAIDPATPVSALPIGQQQIVEIARALAQDVRILILDEPTSALSASEVETLFQVISELRDRGVAIIYISHRLRELLEIGDHITVLRDGSIVGRSPAADASLEWIVERMLGEAQRAVTAPQTGSAGDIVLEVDAATLQRPGGGRIVDDVTAAFRAGEVTAIYGLLGAGRTELLELICGAGKGAGTVRLRGEDLTALPLHKRVARGIVLVPEDRQRDAVFANLSVGGNLSLSALHRAARAGALSTAEERRMNLEMMERMRVKAPSDDAPIHSLSGGNQQKAVIGRALMCMPQALLLDEPSRGIDVGAHAEILALMRKLAAEGMAIIFATSDVTEALKGSDRVLVMAGGRITADLRTAEASEEVLVRAANATAPLQAAAA